MLSCECPPFATAKWMGPIAWMPGHGVPACMEYLVHSTVLGGKGGPGIDSTPTYLVTLLSDWTTPERVPSPRTCVVS